MINLAFGLILGIASNMNSSLTRATHYGSRFEGRLMANGHAYHSYIVSAASNQYPLGTVLRITNPLTGIGIYAEVTDRTGKSKHGRPMIDLSDAAYDAIGLKRRKGWGWVLVSEVKWPS